MGDTLALALRSPYSETLVVVIRVFVDGQGTAPRAKIWAKNRSTIGLPIRGEALRVFNQRTDTLPPLVKWAKPQTDHAASGSFRTGGLFQAYELPNSPPMLSPPPHSQL